MVIYFHAGDLHLFFCIAAGSPIFTILFWLYSSVIDIKKKNIALRAFNCKELN